MKRLIAIILTMLMLTAMICVSANATTGGTEATASVARAVAGEVVEVVLSVYGIADVTNMCFTYDVPAGVELLDAQWLVECDLQDVDMSAKMAVFASYAAIDMTQKTPVFKMTFKTLPLEAEQGELACQVMFDNISVESNYQLQPQPAADASFVVGYLMGDMNRDGVLSDPDALYLLRHTLFPSRYPIYMDGDVNLDGILSDADALYLLRYILFPNLYPLYPAQ